MDAFLSLFRRRVPAASAVGVPMWWQDVQWLPRQLSCACDGVPNVPMFDIVAWNPTDGSGHVCAHSLSWDVALRSAIAWTRQGLQEMHEVDAGPPTLPLHASTTDLDVALGSSQRDAVACRGRFHDITETCYSCCSRAFSAPDRLLWNVLVWDRADGRVHHAARYLDKDVAVRDAIQLQREALRQVGVNVAKHEHAIAELACGEDGILFSWKRLAMAASPALVVAVNSEFPPHVAHMITSQHATLRRNLGLNASVDETRAGVGTDDPTTATA